MENPEEILHSLEEFSKLKPKDIPRELDEYLCFVAKTGNPVYQWALVKSLFREKLISVITDFYESYPSVEVPHCPNVEVFNYENMKSFILEKLDMFVAAPFTVQRICELLTTPRKEYNRIDKYMRALEKNILVVSTTEPFNRPVAGNAEGFMNGLESEHVAEANNSNDINVEEMDDAPAWPRLSNDSVSFETRVSNIPAEVEVDVSNQPPFVADIRTESDPVIDSVITFSSTESQPFVSIEPVISDNSGHDKSADVTVTITAVPAAVQKRRDSIEPVVPSEGVESKIPDIPNTIELEIPDSKQDIEISSALPSSPSERVESDNGTIEVIPTVETVDSFPSEDNCSEIATTNISLENTTLPKFEQANEVTQDESDSMIQIPIISEITYGINEELDSEASIQSPILCLQEEETSDNDIASHKPSESEVSEEVSTSTPEAEMSTDSHIDSESSLTITREATVSSSDDLNSEVVPEVLEEVCSHEDSSSESIDNTSEAEEKQTEELTLSEIQESASSSTVSETMDINFEEETCQEAPSFNR